MPSKAVKRQLAAGAHITKSRPNTQCRVVIFKLYKIALYDYMILQSDQTGQSAKTFAAVILLNSFKKLIRSCKSFEKYVLGLNMNISKYVSVILS